MDRALKERIIGAVVLVIFAVLVVPVFLDGPSHEVEIVSEPVILPGQNEQARKTRTIVLDVDRSEPVPTADVTPAPESEAGGAATIVATKKAQVTAKPEAGPEQKETPAPVDKPPPDPSTGMWAVQLGSFSSQENAEKLAADLRGQGYAAFLRQVRTGSGQLHRVRIGPQKDRDSAETVAERLQSAGYSGQVVPYP
jgi:DedD protein